MRFSSWIGKDVLSRSGERLGYVVALRLTRDMKKLSCLVCADEEEAEFYLPARAVLSAEDAVIAGRQRFEMPTGQPCPVGRPVYLHTGEFFGVIADVDTGEEPALAVWTEDGERSVPAACAAMGETVIVYPTAEEKRTAGRAAAQNQRSVPCINAKRRPGANCVRIGRRTDAGCRSRSGVHAGEGAGIPARPDQSARKARQTERI